VPAPGCACAGVRRVAERPLDVNETEMRLHVLQIASKHDYAHVSAAQKGAICQTIFGIAG
jgi:hypothetical protein